MILRFHIITLIILLSFLQIVQASEVFSNLAANKKIAPYVLELVLDHITVSKLSSLEAKLIAKELNTLNQNISILSKPDQQFFIISELYKAILNFKFKTKSSIDTINKKQVEDLATKLFNYKVIYSSFAQFIIQSTSNDFQEFLKDGFLDSYQATKGTRNSTYLKESQLKKVLKYSGQWVNTISAMPAEKFNLICTELLIEFIKNAAKQSTVFVLHAQKLTTPLFSIEGFERPELQNLLNSLSSSTEKPVVKSNPTSGLPQKTEAQSIMNDLVVDPVEKASDDIDLIFKNNTFND